MDQADVAATEALVAAAQEWAVVDVHALSCLTGVDDGGAVGVQQAVLAEHRPSDGQDRVVYGQLLPDVTKIQQVVEAGSAVAMEAVVQTSGHSVLFKTGDLCHQVVAERLFDRVLQYEITVVEYVLCDAFCGQWRCCGCERTERIAAMGRRLKGVGRRSGFFLCHDTFQRTLETSTLAWRMRDYHAGWRLSWQIPLLRIAQPGPM